jgi:hypothetical protein
MWSKSAEKGESRELSPRGLLLGGLSAAVLLAAMVVAVLAGAEPPSTAAPNGDVTKHLAPPGPDSPVGDDDQSDQRAVSPAAGFIMSAADPQSAGVEAACAMFRNGSTVAEFASWFEADIGVVRPEEEALIRAIVLEALTETCPEVIPEDS